MISRTFGKLRFADSDEETQVPRALWLLTFSDLLMLLLAFFVMRLAMGTNDKHYPSLQPTAAATTVGESIENPKQLPPVKIAPKGFVAKNGSQTEFILDGVFVGGGEELTFHGMESLGALGASLVGVRGAQIRVEAQVRGNALEGAVNGSQTAWTLAASRAAVAVRQLIDAGVEQQALRAVGTVVQNLSGSDSLDRSSERVLVQLSWETAGTNG